MVGPPRCLQKWALFCFQLVCLVASNIFKHSIGKKYLIWFRSAKTLPAENLKTTRARGREGGREKKKSHFLADGSVWNRSQESCFWFMLNCTLNTEQYSCPFFIRLSHCTYFTFTHAHTHPPRSQRIWSLPFQTSNSCAEKHPHFTYKVRVLDVLEHFPTLSRSTLACHKCWLPSQRQFLLLLQRSFTLRMTRACALTILSVAVSHG